jgi:dihydrodipicolinate synthase/N-acetylneuraminate lyase
VSSYRTRPNEITGSIAPLVTPFTADGAVDHEGLANLVNWQLAQGSHLGGTGFVSATANIAPRATARMYELWTAGDADAALEIHYGLHPLVDLLFVETNPAPVKWVLAQLELIGSGHVRPPLITPSEDGLARIRSLLAAGERYLSPVEGFTTGGES